MSGDARTAGTIDLLAGPLDFVSLRNFYYGMELVTERFRNNENQHNRNFGHHPR